MMARKADKDRVRGDLTPPNYEGAIEVIRDRIVAKKGQVGKVNGEISGLWDQIEKMGVNKEGARIFLRLDGLEEPLRNDVLRTIQAMAAAAGWDKKGDMIDQAAGNVVQMPTPANKSKDKPAKPKKGEETVPPVAAGDADLNPAEVLDRADYIQVMADHIAEQSTLEPPEAHQAAVEVWGDLPNTDRDAPRTRENAIANAQRLIDSWPEEEGAK